MYTRYWKLNSRPFDSSAAPRFYYPSETHQATLLKLRYAVENRRGAALMAGASGLGKTLLVQSLFDELPEEYSPLVHLKFPQMSPVQLLAFLADELTGEASMDTAIDYNLRRIEDALAKNADSGAHALVVIDEAHLLPDAGALETVRLLLNFEPAWTMLLVAQPGLLPALDRMPQLEERFGVKCLLRRFTVDESISYINHRMIASGAPDIDAIFEPSALEMIHQLSEGIPRRINRLCDLSLLIGFAEEQPRITSNQVDAVAVELANTAPPVRRVA